jgi:hypothetical protein
LPLHAAAIKSGVQHVEMMRLLLHEFDADVNMCTHDGTTPMHFAIKHGNIDAIRLLFVVGADMVPPAAAEVRSYVDYTRPCNQLEAMECVQDIISNELTGEQCILCGCLTKRLGTCVACEKVQYCSAECQTQDWHNETSSSSYLYI